MPRHGLLSLPIGLLALIVRSAFADLPYNPTQMFVSPNKDQAIAYAFTPQPSSSQSQLLSIDLSSTIDTSSLPFSTLSPSLPFLDQTTSTPFVPVIDGRGDITVITGDCNTRANQLWRFAADKDGKNGTWSQLSISVQSGAGQSNALTPNFLAAGAAFSPTADPTDASTYIFGGMCPTSSATSSDWTTSANYSNNMLAVSPDTSTSGGGGADKAYSLAAVTSRGPPIPEAGFTMTPLVPTYTNISGGNQGQQQNFVLIGGHTQQAFINMSQVALFSLPEQSWTFLPVDQPDSGSTTDLALRAASSQVEPRSGHTAVLTPDGSAIVVVGGWVGDIGTPATPNVVVLQTGQGYGGSGDWSWNTPDMTSSPFADGSSIYGHGAAMLPGGVMLISGGYSITGSSSKTRRDAQTASSQSYLYNTTSKTWFSSYTNPSHASLSSPDSSSRGALTTTSQKAGFGIGLGLGFAAFAGVLGVYLFYSRQLRKRRQAREDELRDLANGAHHFHAGYGPGGMDDRSRHYGPMQSVYWHERKNSDPQDSYPWAPDPGAANGGVFGPEGSGWRSTGATEAERTGLLVEIPSPTRGLRRSLHSRPYTNNIDVGRPTLGPGRIHPIDERGEYEDEPVKHSEMSQIGHNSQTIDPFQDPPQLQQHSQARERQKEIQGWVDDWSTAAAAMDLSHSNSVSQHSTTGNRSSSPEKSDRTISNLSERSTVSNLSNTSIQRSVAGTVSRGMSQRSVSAAQALFASAAAANLAGHTLGTASNNRDDRSPERRPNTSYRRSQSLTIQPRADTFSTAHSSSYAHRNLEADALLLDPRHDNWATPPESPIKEQRSASVRTALGWMGSVKRALTGSRVEHTFVGPADRLGDRTTSSSPTKRWGTSGSEGLPQRAASASATLWRSKQGARDWDAERGGGGGGEDDHDASPTKSHSRRPDNMAEREAGGPNSGGDEWDVEAAVQSRVVQVMFTVPKEKLRVVNADALSLSDAGVASPASPEDFRGVGDGEGGNGMNGKGKGKAL